MSNVHDIIKQFESAICSYTGAPYCVVVDNASNALSMCLIYLNAKGPIIIPSNTYPSVPCEIILAGGSVLFDSSHPAISEPTPDEMNYFENYYFDEGINPETIKTIRFLTGEYQLVPYPIWDSALRFTADMYRPGQFQCLSFTGQWKSLQTCKGGAILTDDRDAYKWFKRYRFSGRREKSYHGDYFDMIGKNYTLHPVFATMGLQFIDKFRNFDGSKKHNPDLRLPYPDLSKYPAYK